MAERVVVGCLQCGGPKKEARYRYCSYTCSNKGRMRPKEERFFDYVRKDANGCWMWTGGKDRDGYAVFCIDKTSVRAHRWAYRTFIGPIPDGLVLDHLCCNPPCVNPEHLEPITNHLNLLRSPKTLVHRYLTATECKYGHPWTPENTRQGMARGRSHRVCKTCRRDKDREQKRRKNGYYERHTETLHTL